MRWFREAFNQKSFGYWKYSSIEGKNFFNPICSCMDWISVAILKQNEAGAKVPDLCREHGISQATFYKWRSKYGGMYASLMKRVKELEDENRRLKKIYAEEKLKAEIAKEAIEKSGKAIVT